MATLSFYTDILLQVGEGLPFRQVSRRVDISICVQTGVGASRGQCGHPGILLHHPNPASVQADTTLTRLENPCPHFQSIGQRAGLARLLSRLGYRRFRQFGLLR